MPTEHPGYRKPFLGLTQDFCGRGPERLGPFWQRDPATGLTANYYSERKLCSRWLLERRYLSVAPPDQSYLAGGSVAMIPCGNALRATGCSPPVALDSSALSFLRILLSLEARFSLTFRRFTSIFRSVIPNSKSINQRVQPFHGPQRP